MNVVEYDPSFSGFLSATAYVLGLPGDSRLSLRRVDDRARSEDLFGGRDGALRHETDLESARGLWKALKEKIGGELQDAIAEAYLSEIPGIEDALAEYISIALRAGRALRDRLAERAPLAVEKAARKTRAEAHRFLGLVRFAELADGSLYAAIEPGCAILPLIADHFSERLPGYVWAIRDLKRDEALFHEAGKRAVLERGLRLEGKPLLSEMEESIRAAWREYFARVSIEERKNPGLQASHMPKKYWKWLPEMEGRSR